MDKRLVLQYEKGRITFRHFDNAANDESLFSLATELNGFQDDPIKKVLVVTSTEFEV